MALGALTKLTRFVDKLMVDAGIRPDLSALTGAGILGFNSSNVYPINTVGAALSEVSARSAWLIGDGTDKTAEFLALAAAFKNTGKTLHIPSGIVRITAAITLEGFIVSLADSAQIEVFGDVSTPFAGGAFIVGPGAVLQGGTIYTNGLMPATAGSKVIRQTGGRVYGVTVYSQLDEVVNHTAGYLDLMMYGGKTRGVRSQPAADIPFDFNVRWYNVGIRYINKLAVAGVPTDSRAFHFYPQVTVTRPVRIKLEGDHCWKNAAWVGGSVASATDVIITGNINRSGFYINENGVETVGHGAGTAITVDNCPNAKVIDCITNKPMGYNISFVGGSHGAQLIGGSQYGAGGDPVVVVVNSNDTEIGSLLIGGTVGVSVGEGSIANNTRITADIRNMTAAPMTFFAGNGLHFTGSISGEPNYSGYTGTWSGPGEVRVMLRVSEAANDITFAPSAVQGWFSHDVVDLSNIPGRLRVARSGAAPFAPILNRNDIAHHKCSRESVSARFVRLIDNDVTGHAFVGEFSLPGTGQAYGSMAVATDFIDMTAFDVTGTDLATVWAKYAVLVYIKYVPGALSNKISFSLQTSAVTPAVGDTFYGTFGNPATVVFGDNSIMGKLHKLTDGEWIPLIMPLSKVITTDPANNLLRFMVWKRDNPTTFDLTITKPVLVYIGTPERV